MAYFETGSNDGYKAVLNVIYNRCLSSKFGGRKTSISTEVYRKSQFTVVTGSKFETTTAPDKIVEFADDIFNGGKTVLPEDVFFFRSAKSGTTWGDRVYYDTIGGNAFITSSIPPFSRVSIKNPELTVHDFGEREQELDPEDYRWISLDHSGL